MNKALPEGSLKNHDRLRNYLEREGVRRSIRCIGCGSAEGLGLRVRVRLEARAFLHTR